MSTPTTSTPAAEPELVSAYHGLVAAFEATGNSPEKAHDLAIGTLARDERSVAAAHAVVDAEATPEPFALGAEVTFEVDGRAVNGTVRTYDRATDCYTVKVPDADLATGYRLEAVAAARLTRVYPFGVIFFCPNYLVFGFADGTEQAFEFSTRTPAKSWQFEFGYDGWKFWTRANGSRVATRDAA